jgi:hypothetical protein
MANTKFESQFFKTKGRDNYQLKFIEIFIKPRHKCFTLNNLVNLTVLLIRAETNCGFESSHDFFCDKRF